MKIGDYDDGYNDGSEPAKPDIPTSRLALEGGPMDGMVIDWTNASNFPEEIAFKFTNRDNETGKKSLSVYGALDFYQDGAILDDGLPARETQVYMHLQTKVSNDKSLTDLWDEATP